MSVKRRGFIGILVMQGVLTACSPVKTTVTNQYKLETYSKQALGNKKNRCLY